VCLHEFGHAAMAYLGGDANVAQKGYLTFDPRRYTHPILSIVFPILFVLLGGIPLPGGAVYINEHLIRTRRMRSLTSAAGPTMTLFSAFILWIPLIIFRPVSGSEHDLFWGAWSFLMYLEILAVFINLLPIPGLDGYGIIEHYLPLSIVDVANRVRPYGMLILLAFFMLPNPIRTLLDWAVTGVCSLLGVDMRLVMTGMSVLPRLF
jgi:Zn-dependent protease